MKKILALIMACSTIHHALANSKSETLTQEQLVEVLVDLELAKAIIDNQESGKQPEAKDALFQEQVQLICDAHAIDTGIFQKTYINYLTEPNRLEVLYDQLINKLEKFLQESY